jgi:hypothetical protein
MALRAATGDVANNNVAMTAARARDEPKRTCPL